MDVLRIRIPVPIIGTNEVRDIVRIVCELHTLDALRRKIKWHDHLQWDSMDKTPTWYNNSWEAREEYYEAGAIYSSNENKVYAYTSPT